MITQTYNEEQQFTEIMQSLIMTDEGWASDYDALEAEVHSIMDDLYQWAT